MPEPKKLLVFLSHASQDKPAVRRLCKRLKADGFEPWLDEERLLPGQDWSLEIEKAMRRSDAILLCFSALSVAKEGYIQREYKRAMQYQEEKPEGTIFVIPVRLDKCEMPFSMRGIQWVDFPAGYERLRQALNLRAGSAAKPPAPKKKAEEKKKPAKRKAAGDSYQAELHGDGAIAQGDGAVAVGAGGFHIGGNVSGRNIVTGNNNRPSGDITTPAPAPKKKGKR